MNDTAIKVENLSKRYRIGLKEEIHDTLAGAVKDFVRRPWRNLRQLRRLSTFNDNGQRPGQDADDIIWALKDISFTVQRGEVVGIIGRNGAGKSTLLKILTRITPPTSGRIEIRGRVSSLLEVGTGFHPELTGRENIYLNGTILGMRKAEIDRKFDEIVNFSGIEKFIDTPVKRYSSGMGVRLAFSVAAFLEPEILLIDEVLAVGDAEFQRKCLGKMGDVAKSGRTVLFVSHNLAAVANLCDTGIYLDQGGVVGHDLITSVLEQYSLATHDGEFHSTPSASAKAYISSARFLGPSTIDHGQKLSFEVVIQATEELSVSLDWRVKDESGTPLIFGCPHAQYGRVDQLQVGVNRFVFEIGPLPLTEGRYSLSFDIDIPWTTYLERVEDSLYFTIRRCVMIDGGESVKAIWRNGSIVVPFDFSLKYEGKD